MLSLDQQLSLYTGDGTGALKQGLTYGAGAGAWQNLVSGDFLGDGKPGLAFANPYVSTFSLVLNITR